MGDLQDNGLVIRLPSMSIAIDDLLFGFRPARWAWKPLLKHLATGSFVPLAMRPGCSPVALVLPVDRRLEMAYWLYWPVYELKLCDADFHEPSSEDLEAVYGRLLGPRLPGGVAAGSEAVVGRLAA